MFTWQGLRKLFLKNEQECLFSGRSRVHQFIRSPSRFGGSIGTFLSKWGMNIYARQLCSFAWPAVPGSWHILKTFLVWWLLHSITVWWLKGLSCLPEIWCKKHMLSCRCSLTVLTNFTQSYFEKKWTWVNTNNQSHDKTIVLPNNIIISHISWRNIPTTTSTVTRSQLRATHPAPTLWTFRPTWQLPGYPNSWRVGIRKWWYPKLAGWFFGGKSPSINMDDDWGVALF